MTPEKTFRKIAEKVDWRRAEITVVVGFADVAHLATEYRPDTIVVMHDPTSSPPEDLMARLTGIVWNGCHVCVICEEILRTYGDGVGKAIEDAREHVALADYTVRKNALRWTEAGMKVIPHLPGKGSANHLGAVLRGVPAVIVGAGPSLDRNISVLARLQDRLLVIATDGALGPLIDEGIQPHMICSLEAHSLALSEILYHPVWHDAIAVLGPHVHEQAFDVDAKFILPAIMHSGPVGRWVADRLRCDQFKIGGSVSHLACQVADLLGCSPVILVGMDCAYGEKQYAEGVRHSGATGAPNDAGMVTSWGGESTVSTSPQLDAYRRWFEVYAKSKGDEGSRLIDATEGGARINGALECSLSDIEEVMVDYGNFVAKLNLEVETLPKIESGYMVAGLLEEQDFAKKTTSAARDAAESLQKAIGYIDAVSARLHGAKIHSLMSMLPTDKVAGMPDRDHFDNMMWALTHTADTGSSFVDLAQNAIEEIMIAGR